MKTLLYNFISSLLSQAQKMYILYIFLQVAFLSIWRKLTLLLIPSLKTGLCDIWILVANFMFFEIAWN